MIRHLTAAVAALTLALTPVALIVRATAGHAAEGHPAHLLPMCPTDEGPDGQANRGCVWYARGMGNGEGRSFVIRRDRDAAHGTLIYVTDARALELLADGVW